MHKAPHPYICAYVLAGGFISKLASEMNRPQYRITKWVKGEPVQKVDLPQLRKVAEAAVRAREQALRELLLQQPQIVKSKNFRRDLDDLDIAHRMMFGRSLIDFLIWQEQTKDNQEYNDDA